MRFPRFVLFSYSILAISAVLSGCGGMVTMDSKAPAPGTGPVPTVAAVGQQVNGVAPNRKQEVQFSEAMDPSTINTQTFQITDSSGKLMQGAVSYDPNFNTASFLPNPALQMNANYTATITTGVASSGGMHLANPYSYTFDTRSTTDTSPITVNSVAPAAGATCVITTTPITITFNEGPDASTLTAANFAVTGPSGSIPVKISANIATTQVVLTPTSPLPSGSITVTVNHVADLAGVAMASSYTWTFSTACGGGGGGGDNASVSFSATTYPGNDLLWNYQNLTNATLRADLNGDGRDDLVTLMDFCRTVALVDSTFTVRLSTGDGTYGPPACYTIPASPLDPLGFVAGDFFGNGHLDLAVTDEHNHLSLWRNAGDGTFTLAPTSAITSGFNCRLETNINLTVDINHDGKADLVCEQSRPRAGDNQQFQVLFGNGDGTFTPGPVTQSTSQNGLGEQALADFDGDGNIDLLTSAIEGEVTQIFYGDGKGNFTPGQSIGGSNPETSSTVFTQYDPFDIDSNGTTDLIGSPHTSTFCGDLCFPPPSTFDNYLDVEISHPDRTLTSQQVPMQNCQAYAGPPQVADFDGDGIPDIIVACLNAGQSTLEFLKGSGKGTYQTAQVIYTTNDKILQWFTLKNSSSGLPGFAVSQLQINPNAPATNPEEVIFVNTTK
jgi:hypothetical protein